MLRTLRLGISRAGRLRRVLPGLAAVLTMAGLVVYPRQSAETAGRAAAMCMELILPSLFPFLALSNLIISLGFAESLGRLADPVMRRVFRLNGTCAGVFLMGIAGGYPIGAKSAISVYEQGLCSRTECERMLSFCNNSGPAFILGVVGSGIFSSTGAGLLLWLAHVLASLTVGVLFRFYRYREPIAEGQRLRHAPVRPAKAFADSVRNALAGVGNISAFVIFFAVAVNLLFASGLLDVLSRVIAAPLSGLGVDRARVTRLLTGAIEITSGLRSLQGAGAHMGADLSMAAFLLGWAGVSVHCQVLSFLGDSGLSLLPYLTGKLLHAGFSALYTAVLLRIFPLAADAAAPAAGQAAALAARTAAFSPLPVLSGCCLLCLVFAAADLWEKFANRV